jgi:hypothetical protein
MPEVQAGNCKVTAGSTERSRTIGKQAAVDEAFLRILRARYPERLWIYEEAD